MHQTFAQKTDIGTAAQRALESRKTDIRDSPSIVLTAFRHDKWRPTKSLKTSRYFLPLGNDASTDAGERPVEV